MYQNRLEDIVTLINKNLKDKEEDKSNIDTEIEEDVDTNLEEENDIEMSL